MSNSKNVHAFEKLAGLCTGYGGSYKPGNGNLQVEALITRLHNAQQLLQNVTEAETAYANAINSRERLLDIVKDQSSRIISVLKSGGVDTHTLYDAQISFRKFRGYRKKVKPQQVAKEGETPTASTTGFGTDYASMVSYFAKLVEMVSLVEKYRPSEEDLSVENMEQTLSNLRKANEEVMQSEVTMMLARKNRDEFLYTNDDSMHNTMKAVKAYVRGAFGFKSTEHVQLIRLRFTKRAA